MTRRQNKGGGQGPENKGDDQGWENDGDDQAPKQGRWLDGARAVSGISNGVVKDRARTNPGNTGQASPAGRRDRNAGPATI